MREKYEDDFQAGMGAEAIQELLGEIDLENGFSLQGEIGTISNNYEEEVRRIVFVNGNYYTLSYSQVRVADMDSLNVFKIIDI